MPAGGLSIRIIQDHNWIENTTPKCGSPRDHTEKNFSVGFRDDEGESRWSRIAPRFNCRRCHYCLTAESFSSDVQNTSGKVVISHWPFWIT